MLDPVEVSFARNWDPYRGGRSQLSRLSAEDMNAIRANLADLFRETLRAELARGGYQLVDEAGRTRCVSLPRSSTCTSRRPTTCRPAARAPTPQTPDA